MVNQRFKGTPESKETCFLKGKKEEYKEKEKEFSKNARATRLRYKNKIEEKN